MDIGKKKVSFPMVANYNSVVRYFVECGLDAQFIMPPKMTRRTLEIGSRYSPDYVCAPFKSTLGSMIDALEAGADTLVMTMGLCRLGYYGELQEQIIRDLFGILKPNGYRQFNTAYIEIPKKMARVSLQLPSLCY